EERQGDEGRGTGEERQGDGGRKTGGRGTGEERQGDGGRGKKDRGMGDNSKMELFFYRLRILDFGLPLQAGRHWTLDKRLINYTQ
ncbi:MAG: hypothetical protein ACM34K_15700, partial [Bacillota bacterium]